MIFFADVFPVPDAANFWQFIISAWALYAIYARYIETQANKAMLKAAQNDKPKREISGTLESVPSKEPALKAEVEQRFTKVEQHVESIEQQALAESQALQRGGQERVVALSELIRSELSTRDDRISDMKDAILNKIEDSMQRAYHRINRHGECIASLNTAVSLAHGGKVKLKSPHEEG